MGVFLFGDIDIVHISLSQKVKHLFGPRVSLPLQENNCSAFHTNSFGDSPLNHWLHIAFRIKIIKKKLGF